MLEYLHCCYCDLILGSYFLSELKRIAALLIDLEMVHSKGPFGLNAGLTLEGVLLFNLLFAQSFQSVLLKGFEIYHSNCS